MATYIGVQFFRGHGVYIQRINARTFDVTASPSHLLQLLWRGHWVCPCVCDCCRVWSRSTTECDGAGRWRGAASMGQVTIRLHISTHARFGLFSVDPLIWICVYLYVYCCEHGGVNLMGLKPNPHDLSSFSALTLWLGHLTRKNPSPIWPIMCLVGC